MDALDILAFLIIPIGFFTFTCLVAWYFVADKEVWKDD